MIKRFAYARAATATTAAETATSAGRKLNFYLWLLLVVTNVIDVLGTQRAFERGVRELNPLVELFYQQFGMVSIALVKALFLGLLYYLIPYIRGWNRVLFAFACSVYLALSFAHIAYL